MRQLRIGPELADYTRVIEMPDAPPEQVANALGARGGTYGQQRDVQAARADLRRALELDALDPKQTDLIRQALSQITGAD